jgi:tRNA A-37 threonylcarbamoyl transferase component Bud32
VSGAPQQSERLAHGYTNLTTLEGGRVIKRYAGPDALLRGEAEVTALKVLAGRFPVPALIGQDDSQLALSFVPGVPGQEILEQRPDEVLFAVGRTGRALHGLDVSAAYEIGGGTVLVHGDFGPQNMVFDATTLQPAAVVDWEFAHPGDPVEDMAWAEWIVRTHHPQLVDSLGTMFEGYGSRQPWRQRHAAMLEKCRWALDFVRRWPAAEAASVAMWQRRLDVTTDFRD